MSTKEPIAPVLYEPPKPWWNRQETKDRALAIREMVPSFLIALVVLLFVGSVLTVILRDRH